MLNPLNPSEFLLGDGTVIFNVHNDILCEGRGCSIHHPSDHGLTEWPLTWRNDRGFFERTCVHGIGHPDPDDTAYHASVGNNIGIHGCDGCCAKADHPR